MNKPLILVVEDDAPVRSLIATTLKTHDYKYLSAQNGAGAITEVLSHNPDVVLLDLGLPDMDGVDVIRKIRSWSNMPIIVISARTEDSDKIEALDAGADDYLTKPFSVEELLGSPKPESTAPLEPQAILADKLGALTGQLAEQNHRRRRFWKWVAIVAGVCALLLLPQLGVALFMLGIGLPIDSSIGIIGGADGPTAIFVTAGFPWGLIFAVLGCIALAILGILMSRRPD